MLKQKPNLLLIATAFALLSIYQATPAIAGHSYDKKLFNLDARSIEAKVVKPGDGVTCSNDFALENMNGQDLEVLMILGGQPFSKEQILKNSVKMFDLRKNLAVAKLNGKPVNMDDWAFVINGRNNQNAIRIHCAE